ncbi:Nse4 C-terminal-domain-containing protein [Lentinula raphanica]|nr:Nse4 C-terminal-domain-containing protein [Lentinula raphanica]
MSMADEGSWYPDSSPLIYNPDQDPNERRQLRRKYRTLQLQLQDSSKLGSELGGFLSTADFLFNRVKDTPEALLDANFLADVSAHSNRMSRRLNPEFGMFDFDEYVLKLVIYAGGRKLGLQSTQQISDDELDDSNLVEPLKWERIGKLASRKNKRVAIAGFMAGPISRQGTRKRKRSGRMKKNPESRTDVGRPQELTQKELSERPADETMRNVLTIHAILRDAGPTNFFQFIMNPASFAQSVENLFYMSFLFREGRLGLYLGEDNEPIVYVPDEDAHQSRSQLLRNSESHSAVFEIDMVTWKRAVEVFNISDPLIPHRNERSLE